MNSRMLHNATSPASPASSWRRSVARLAVLVLLAGLLQSAHAAEVYLQALTNASSVGVYHEDSAVGKDGSLYVVGNYWNYTSNYLSDLKIGTTTLLRGYEGDRANYIAKLGTDGGWRWAIRFFGPQGSGAYGTAVAVSGNNLYVAGVAKGSVTVEDTARNLSTITANGSSTVAAPFVFKFDLNGKFLSGVMAKASQTMHATVNDMVVDSQDNIYIAGVMPATRGILFTNSVGSSPITPDMPSPGGGYLAKLNSSLSWQWVVGKWGSGVLPGLVPDQFFSLSVDESDRIYAAGMATGDASDRWYNRDGSPASQGANPAANSVGLIARFLPDGTWDPSAPWRWLVPSGSGFGVRAKAISWVLGKVYVAVEFESSVHPGIGSNSLAVARGGWDVALLRLTADLKSYEKVTAIGGAGGEQIAPTIGSDSLGNVYVSGLFGEPQATFGTNGSPAFQAAPDSAPTGPDVTTSRTNLYIGKLDRDLVWQWVQRSAGVPPNFMRVPTVAVEPTSGRAYLFGGFYQGPLRVGPDFSQSEIMDDPATWAAYLTALQSDGQFLEQVTLNVISDYGGSSVQPVRGSQTYLRGQSVQASVPPLIYEDAAGNQIDPKDTDGINDRAVVRRTCLGYEVLGTATAGSAANYGFTITQDTDLQFNWQTDYALIVSNNLSGSLGGLQSTAAGNPDPVVQKHWIAENTLSTAFIDGVIPSPNANEYGTRYRSTGYFGSGATAPPGKALDFTNGWIDLGARSEYQPGSGPWTVELWVRSDTVDQYSRRIINWDPLFYFTQESAGGTNFIFASTNSFAGNLMLTGVPVRQGEWHHFAFVKNNTTWTVYYDGQVVATQPATGAVGTTTNPLLLGQFFDGAIDDLRIWQVARTQSEIQRYMQRPLPNATSPDLYAYWDFDTSFGGNIADLRNPAITKALSTNAVLSAGTVPDRTGAFQPWAGVQPRQQVPQFIMSEPAVIEYRWVKENRVQVGVAAPSLAASPVIVSGSFTTNGTGEFWFSNGAPVRISAPETASAGGESYQLKGYVGGTGEVTPVTGEGVKTNGIRYYQISQLNQGSSITWDYSDRIFKGRVTIGEALNFAAGGSFPTNEMIPASDMLQASNAPLSTVIVSGAPPGSSIDDMRVWDDVADKLYPVRPGVILLEWGRQPGSPSSRSIFTEITIVWPTNASFSHIANTPPVQLDQDKTNSVTFFALKYSQSDKAVVNDAAEFSVTDTSFTDPFWSVLVFTERLDGTPANGDLTRERIRVRTVRTKKWDNGLELASAEIGSPIKSAYHSTNAPHNGYVYFEKARYNAGIYNRSTRQGPIIPVNLHPNARLDEKFVVVWYATQEGIHWPYQTVQYTPYWPVVTNRIVIASRLGSEGLNLSNAPQFTFSGRYGQASIYNQPDKSLPGYNPNEEHAFIAPSLFNATAPTPPSVAYALRNNLNNTNLTDAYTSDPYVLVQYFDNLLTNWNMAVYLIQNEDLSLPRRRLEFDLTPVAGNYVSIGSSNVLEFNSTAFLAGLGALRTNEAVNLELNNNLLDASSGRYFLIRANDNKFVLSATPGGTPITASAITPGERPKVVVTRAYPYVFEYEMVAGDPVLAPYPLQQIIGATPCLGTRGENIDPSQLVYWEDHNKQPWAISGSTNPAVGLRAQFYYPLQPFFWHPTSQPGDCIPYVADSATVWVSNHVSWPLSVPVLKGGETLTFSGGEINRDNPNAPGVPGVIGWAAGQIVYDDGNAAMNPSLTVANYLARLGSPLAKLTAALPVSKVPASLLPASGNVTVNGAEWTFKALDASLQPRVFYDQSAQKLCVRGFVDGKTIGDPTLTAAPGSISILQPNILTVRDSNALVSLVASAPADWVNAVSNLVRLSRDPAGAANGGYGVGLAPNGSAGQAVPATQFGPGLALLPNAAFVDVNSNLRDGYVTLVENDDVSMGAAPVTLRIICIQKQPMFRGAIKTINPANPFDEKLTLRHSGDFGANGDSLRFEWYYRPDDGQTVAPPDQNPAAWSLFADTSGRSGLGMAEIKLGGGGEITLADNRFFVRWRHDNNPTNWSQWAGAANSRPPATNELAQDTYVPQLAEGWVKRVTGAINPFDARISDFRNNNSPATYVSMVQQAGAPYRGPVALNADQNVVENVGLIELYTTVINRAKSLSIDLGTSSSPAVNNAILLAASRIADLQLLLGNEAYTDAQDPTIGFGTSSSEYGSLAPTIFCFQNQVATLMDEELALLRGRSEEGAYPAFNRLLWNFTRAEGEAAYALSYNIADKNVDGFINEADARIMYPQGHGDAWGHYLSALRTYYDLLRHPNFNWQARSETLSIEGVVVNVDYLDERKFAQAAAAKAKAGSELVNLTYRSRYVEDPDGQWQGYQDTDASRAWGVSDWARRAGCAALYDWVTANAILPAVAPAGKTGIEKVDRTTVKELAQIATQAGEIRKQLGNANTGLNPLGLATDVVPFDIDPTGVDEGATQFEQVYDRALKAMGNALDVFNYANQLNNMLRQVANTAEQFAQDTQEQDLDFRNRLIETFGTPYEGAIGAGKAYPAGYNGPDLYLYMYVDVTGIQNVPPPSAEFSAFFKPMERGFVNTGAAGGGGDSIASAWSHYFKGDAPSLTENTNTDFSQVLELKLPQTASGYAFQAPSGWGSRRAPGEIQQVLSELVQTEADLQLALHAYDGLLGDIGDILELIRAQSGLQADTISYEEEGIASTTKIQGRIEKLRAVSSATALASDLADRAMDGIVEGLPKTVGLAYDVAAPIRSALKIGFAGTVYAGLKGAAIGTEQAAFGLEGSKEIAALQTALKVSKAEYKYAMQEQLKEFEALLGDEAAKRIEVFRKQEALRQVSDKYRATLETGLRLMEERTLHNKRTAGATQQNRYQDFTFRVARNDALSKHRAAFDLAARYVYLAAKAYDYETNLDPNDSASARPILTQIIRARTLGAMDNGVPRLGSGGLADAMATLKVNFDVLKTQMGFNNPQTESGRFSLRNELFRIAPGPMLNGQRDTSTNRVSYAGATMTAAAAWDASDAKWRDALQNTSGGGFTAKVIPDLWQVPEFRRYCRPFAPESAGAQPGLVITFGSQIVFGKNFFGWPLSGGDSAYDPSHFATKVRSVGLWFENYNGEGLSVTPRAYLVPAGLDIMLVPTSADLATREWNVVDQKIPVPLPVSQSNLRDPSWIPLRDSLNGTIAEIRRYSMFRAYHDSGFTTDEMTSDSRLVGRSVWNTRWMIIIPGGTFLASGQEGLDTFIKGRVVPGGTARDGNGVKDIKLFFQTYAYSGN